ncbi:hypothetical protein [Morganella morganii]|uniref:hypothetical protein n=1 Tax=Morganella morganii TaxID=582 RepID=UPI0013D61CDF|nr:hypothetical protein [Morganella morganii]
MFGLDNKSGINVMPPIAPADSQTPLWFTEGGAGLSATYPGQDWFNQIQAELLNVLNEAGITPEKGRLNQLSQSIKAIISKDYATKSDVDKKLDKEKVTNSLIDSREHVTSSALLVAELKKKQPAGKYQPEGDYATVDELKKIIPPKGMVSFFLHRENSLPAGWYSLNGDRYSVDSFAGKALRALPEEIKSDWKIIDSGTTITTPNLRQPDGRLPFIRPSNSKGTAPGIVSGDTMRNINGEFGYESQYGLATSDSDVTGAFYRFGPSRKSFMGGGTGQTTNIAFSADRVVDTGPEFKPLSIDMVVAVYLGVA